MTKDNIPKVSIIVPVYNSDEYLRDTLKSIQNQSFKDFEAIIINDGSIDRSSEIIDSFIYEDSRFCRIDQSNLGVSVARNTGLDYAKGEFVTFVDGDDILPKDALQAMDNVARNNKCDVIIGGIQRIDGFTKNVNERVKSLNTKRVIKKDDLDMVHGLSLCNKWFRRSIIEDNHIRLESYRHLEDGVFFYRFLKYANRVHTCEKIIYHYYKRVPLNKGSVTQQVCPGLILDAVAAYKRLLELTVDYSDEFHQELTYRIVRTTLIGDYYRKIWMLTEEDENFLVATLNNLWGNMTAKYQERIIKSAKDLHFETGVKSRKQLTKSTEMIIAITSAVSEQGLQNMLKSLYGQRLTNFKLLIDSCHAGKIPDNMRNLLNLEIVDVQSEKDWLNSILQAAEGSLLIVDHDGYFDYDTLYFANESLYKENVDYVSIKVKNGANDQYFINKLLNLKTLKKKGFCFDEKRNLDLIALTSSKFNALNQENAMLYFLEDKSKQTEEENKKRESIWNRIKKHFCKPKKKEEPSQKKSLLDFYLDCEV